MSEKTSIKVERVFITVAMAEKWLRLNVENNRPINLARVAQYVRDLKAGKWPENGETIKFSTDGKLIDGQHRLTAAVECGIGFWTIVVTGVTPDAIVTIDRNQPRSIGQQLKMKYGIADHNALQAALGWLTAFYDGIVVSSRPRPTAGELVEVFEENPGMVESLLAASGVQRNLKTPSKSALGFAHYCFTRQDATKAEGFFEALSTGANLRPIDPVFRLRERIISSASNANRRLSTLEFIALLFKAWLAEKEGRTIETGLRWGVGESFPNIGPIGTKKRRPEAMAAAAVKESGVKKRFGKAGKVHGQGNARAVMLEQAKVLRHKYSIDRA